MSDSTKPPVLYWIISILAVIWNAMGVGAYLMMTRTPIEEITEQYGQAFADIFATKPAWATGAFAIAVFAGLLGSLALLIRKKWAFHLFVLSFIGVIVHNIWGVMAGTLSVIGTGDKVMTVLVMLIAIFLIWFARKKTAKGILT